MGLVHGEKSITGEDLWAAHEQRAGAFVAEALASTKADATAGDMLREGRAWSDRLFSSPPEAVGSALMLLLLAAASRRLPWVVTMTVKDLTRRRWSLSRADAFLALATTTRAADDWQAGWAFKTSEAILRRATVGTSLTDEETSVVRAAVTSLEGRQHLPSPERREVRARLVALLPSVQSGTVDVSVIVPGDGWSVAVLPDLAGSSSPDEVSTMLRHLATATGSKPSQTWLTGLGKILQNAEAARVVRVLLERLVSAEPVVGLSRYGIRVPMVLNDQNADLAQAAVWAGPLIEQPWLVPTLHRLAIRGISQPGLIGWMSGDKVPNAAICVLGQLAGPDAVVALQQLADSTKHNGFRKRIAGALAQAAQTAGITPSQLVERTVSTAGLDDTGTAHYTAGGVTARASVDEQHKVTTHWQTGQSWSSKPPSEADAAEVKQVKTAVKELKDLLGAERRRVEGLLATDRSWDLDSWRRYYLEHPVSGRLSRRLIWTFDTGSRHLTGLPVDADTVRTPTGNAPLPEAATVRLWHPASASTSEVSVWRDLLLLEQGVQPFKQAFREIYLLTPAERETATYSNRFAAHVLSYQQLYALFKDRGWAANYLGPYDGGYEGRARHEFPDAGLTAVFEHLQIDPDAGAFRPDLCSTDRVWFFRTTDRTKTAVPLDDVPPLVFSETMRDVDLFVAVTSIALDPTWADRGQDPHYDYWLAASFGELTATAEVRRDVLAKLLPKLRISDRVELGDRHVRVHGTRATYKVHLGSTNILIEPDDRYLCIVPAGHGSTKRVMLPFEGDTVLTLILSKVLMLASDNKITDPAILSQIDRR